MAKVRQCQLMRQITSVGICGREEGGETWSGCGYVNDAFSGPYRKRGCTVTLLNVSP